MSKRFLQGMWAGVTLVLVGVSLWSHGNVPEFVIAATVLIGIIGGLFVVMAEAGE